MSTAVNWWKSSKLSEFLALQFELFTWVFNKNLRIEVCVERGRRLFRFYLFTALGELARREKRTFSGNNIYTFLRSYDSFVQFTVMLSSLTQLYNQLVEISSSDSMQTIKMKRNLIKTQSQYLCLLPATIFRQWKCWRTCQFTCQFTRSIRGPWLIWSNNASSSEDLLLNSMAGMPEPWDRKIQRRHHRGQHSSRPSFRVCKHDETIQPIYFLRLFDLNWRKR